MISIWIDEWGNGVGTRGAGFRGPDPTGGIYNWNVLIYNLPFAGTPGDLQVYEQRNGRKLSQVIRFTGHSQLVFYSNDVGGLNEPADTPTPPQNAWPVGGMNAAQVDVTGSEGVVYAFYQPRAGQPGWDATGPSYTIVIKDPLPGVPEPCTAALLTLGGAAALLRRRR
jgi:hypothetical protein